MIVASSKTQFLAAEAQQVSIATAAPLGAPLQLGPQLGPQLVQPVQLPSPGPSPATVMRQALMGWWSFTYERWVDLSMANCQIARWYNVYVIINI